MSGITPAAVNPTSIDTLKEAFATTATGPGKPPPLLGFCASTTAATVRCSSIPGIGPTTPAYARRRRLSRCCIPARPAHKAAGGGAMPTTILYVISRPEIFFPMSPAALHAESLFGAGRSISGDRVETTQSLWVNADQSPDTTHCSATKIAAARPTRRTLRRPASCTRSPPKLRALLATGSPAHMHRKPATRISAFYAPTSSPPQRTPVRTPPPGSR
jgi:hypothetical protein